MPTTPGVYIQEMNAFPHSIVAVETAVPVFIGYTEKAGPDGHSLLNKPTRIHSLIEYEQLFGGAFKSRFTINKPLASERTIKIDNKAYAVRINEHEQFIFYNAIRLFYANGGNVCYILSVKTYGGGQNGFAIDLNDFSSQLPTLEKETEPTLIVMPDVCSQGAHAYKLYQEVLQHCQKMQNRFAILDVYHKPGRTIEEDAAEFRQHIGTDALNYGAAYYPYLHTSLVEIGDVDFDNLDTSVNLVNLLPEPAAKIAVEDFLNLNETDTRNNLHKKLLAISPTYKKILEEIRFQLNVIPPGAAIAGIYTMVDQTRGVWKAPANISVSMVLEPAVNITHQQQQDLNVDAITGKSINAIRQFTGAGTLVWGARTLNGNSLDWRYINVRRTVIMIEQSIKIALASYVFEANNATTWKAINNSVSTFLHSLWKQGALQGNVPQDSFAVQIGQGSTMTGIDILNGILRLNVLLAIVRPAEFISLSFQQQQQV